MGNRVAKVATKIVIRIVNIGKNKGTPKNLENGITTIEEKPMVFKRIKFANNDNKGDAIKDIVNEMMATMIFSKT